MGSFDLKDNDEISKIPNLLSLLGDGDEEDNEQRKENGLERCS